eukprot:gnl/TRDRNA2_/TRDRNA2_36264_c0_seq1.p1 gnl/TRDRNA2_/TRDRNA2_36264_c0~~gnl/TRDRNA2_/TRDRNA2_36264_c0_seq1.p1  ORF type:complete len:341 (+),score=109.06 gnl/TRDRNA2_/TRDRNA2_36264_c0_seq1:63-1085(+)
MAPKDLEKRIDPEDGCAYTFEEIAAHYKGKFKKKAIQEYWENECKQAKKKGAAKAKVKAKAKAEKPAKAEDEKPKPKAKAKPREAKSLSRKPANPEEVLKRVSACMVVPVIKLQNAVLAAPLCKALKEGGIDVAEITFRTECAAECIQEASKGVEGICVGAGTVVEAKQVDIAIEAGADFVVSPGFEPSVARRCKARNCLYLPGVATPTEVMMVHSKYKLNALKFFPASNYGGKGTLKSFSAVFPDIRFMPTGGVTLDNLSDFLSLPNVMAVGGSWMVNEMDVLLAEKGEKGGWATITEGAKKASDAAKECVAKKAESAEKEGKALKEAYAALKEAQASK